MSARRVAALIGAPTDVGAADRGASMGPEALRVAGLADALRARELEVCDLGNLNGPPNPWQPPRGGYRHLEEVRQWNSAVHESVLAQLAAARLPILLGGDHCLSIG
ncbi:MAG: arginase family protein, partial [Gammaproteobacteria bacterium]|nr:arginase family protein [Gammaproteobacteria bacterium]